MVLKLYVDFGKGIIILLGHVLRVQIPGVALDQG
jgi:hypothetical protein